MKRFTLAVIAALCLIPFAVTGCGQSDADVAATNISKAAEQFQVARRIVFFNGITDNYLLTITGYCSVETGDSGLSGSLEVTCKTGPKAFKKSFLGLSDNVSYMVEQIDPISVSTSRYKVIFKPSTIIPDIAVK